MARFSLNKLPKGQRIQLLGEFYDIIHSLRSREDVREFFRDLLVPDEITMFMRRIEIAALLAGDFSVDEIKKLTGAGKNTIMAVRRKLFRENGGNGYRKVISSLLEQRKYRIQQRQKRIKAAESPLERTKQKYPLAFLLVNILDEVAMRQERKSETLGKQALLYTPSRK